MGVFLGQLPPAEMARLKAELAETLIANFCYPRFYDYRTESLRMRPVDRSKRQEVWLYLSSVDFTTWGRVDLTSPELQSYIERLFIHFVQRNRAFFGEQGRKRMADVRMLITTSAGAVTEGLRSHLTNPGTKKSAFGSPRPVAAWSQMQISEHTEPGWEQIAQMTMQVQQQLQELRGEARPVTNGSDAHMATPKPRSTATVQPPGRPQRDGRGAPAQPAAPAGGTPGAAWPSSVSSAPTGPIPLRAEPAAPAASMAPSVAVVNGKPGSERLPKPVTPTHVPTPEQEQTMILTSSPPPQAQALHPVAVAPQPPTVVTVEDGANGTVSGEDVAIFEEMRYQLILWLRIEALRLGLDISGQSPTQLLDLLRQQTSMDQTRLQVVSTLLNLVTQVMKNGKASLLDYKQGLMFYLMHNRRSV
jgi:hypothetical protein